jgi:hypothetical protein
MSHRGLACVLCIFAFTGLFLGPSVSHGFTTSVGGETITWDFQGIPASSFFIETNPCAYYAATNYWVCQAYIYDPPYGNGITFTSSMTPTQGTFPDFFFGYYHIGDTTTHFYFNWIRLVQWAFPYPGTLSTSFYIPASAAEFVLFYSSDGTGTGAVNVQMEFIIINADPCRASLFGGDDINPNAAYCDENTGPGRPRIRKFHNKKGAGPGS